MAKMNDAPDPKGGAFKAGINFALECLGTLPFGVSYGEASDSESRSEPT